VRYRSNPVICKKCQRVVDDRYLGTICVWCGQPYVEYEPLELDQLEEPETCDCKVCRNMCQRPCWPTPEEANELIDAGYADRLMLDHWDPGIAGVGRLEVITPASPGDEGEIAPFWPAGCNFQKMGLCELHGNFKPIEGRLAHHSKTPEGLHYIVAKTWNSPAGKRVVRKWKKLMGHFLRNPYVWSPLKYDAGDKGSNILINVELSAKIFDQNGNLVEIFELPEDAIYESIDELQNSLLQQIKPRLKHGYEVEIKLKQAYG